MLRRFRSKRLSTRAARSKWLPEAAQGQHRERRRLLHLRLKTAAAILANKAGESAAVYQQLLSPRGRAILSGHKR